MNFPTSSAYTTATAEHSVTLNTPVRMPVMISTIVMLSVSTRNSNGMWSDWMLIQSKS